VVVWYLECSIISIAAETGARRRHLSVVVAAGEARAAQHATAGAGTRHAAQAHPGGPPHLPRAVRAAALQHPHLPPHQGTSHVL
jgi:hypothetical protein